MTNKRDRNEFQDKRTTKKNRQRNITKKRMMTLSLLEELRSEQDREEKLILTKLKQEKKYDLNPKKR